MRVLFPCCGWLLMSLVSALVAVACQPPWSTARDIPMDQELPFETISLTDYRSDGQFYSGREPKLVLLWSAADITQIEPWIDAADVAALQQVDFGNSAVVALFQGMQNGTGYRVVIERIGLRGQTLVVQAQFWEPAPGTEVGAALTSPYHLVKIPKATALIAQTPLELYHYAIHE